jgi:hypothetical protein
MHGKNAATNDIAATFCNMGEAYSTKRDAMESYNKAKTILDMLDGGDRDHRLYTTVCDHIAELNTKLDADIAEYVVELETLFQQYGRNVARNEIACAYNNLGMAHHIKGELRKAMKWYRKACVMLRALGEGNRDRDLLTSVCTNISQVHSQK